MTLSEGVEEAALLPDASSDAPNVQATRARTRTRIAAESVTKRVRAAGEVVARDVRRVPVFRAAPPAVIELIGYTRAGDWVPGDQAPFLEFLGKAYGWLIAVPISLVLYSVAWLLQRPARLTLAVFIAAIVWLTH